MLRITVGIKVFKGVFVRLKDLEVKENGGINKEYVRKVV